MLMYTTYLLGENKVPTSYMSNGHTHGRRTGALNDPEQVKYFNPHNSAVTPFARVLYPFTSLMSTIYPGARDNGIKQLKSTDGIHKTQYVPQPSFVEKRT